MLLVQMLISPSFSRPPNTAALGTGKKTADWKTSVKGVIYLKQKKHIRGLENQRWYLGEAVNGGAVLGVLSHCRGGGVCQGQQCD